MLPYRGFPNLRAPWQLNAYTPQFDTLPTGKSAIQQTWKSALRHRFASPGTKATMKRPFVTIILAGGKGTRMGTNDKHKVCFEVLGVPVIIRALETDRK